MIYTGVHTETLLKFEDQLSKYLATGQTSFDAIIDAQKDVILQDIKNRGYKIKGLCIPLTLTTTEIKDNAERGMLVVDCTEITDEVNVILKGCDTENGTYINVIDETLAEVGEYIFQLPKFFYYYKIEVNGTITATYNLYETSFVNAHIYKSLEQIYRAKQSRADSNSKDKAEQYMNMYNDEINKIVFSYDKDGNGIIDELEEMTTKTINVLG